MVYNALIRRISFATVMVIIVSAIALLIRSAQAGSMPILTATSISLTTEFSYQGYLALEGQPANGSYDFRFRLYDAQTDGVQVGPENVAEAVGVQNGVFSMYLNFGDVFNGRMRWIEIDVRQTGDAGAYTILTPRQEIHPVPYALYAESTLEMWEFNSVGVDSDTGMINTAYPDIFLSNPPHQQASQRVVLVEAPVVAKQIEALYLIVTGRIGSYDGAYTLEFGVRSYDGTLQHTVSAAPVDLQTVPVQQVVEITLSSDPDDVIVSPGEYLAVTVHRGGEQGGSLEVTLSARALARNALQVSAEGLQ